MTKKKNTTEEAQGAETETAMGRKGSPTFTIKSLKGNIQKLEDLKMCNEEELKILKEMYGTIVKRWIGGNLEF